MLVKEFGDAIKNRRKELNITQPHLAELAQISVNTLYKLEKGQGNPSLEVINKLVEVLGMELIFQVKKETLIDANIRNLLQGRFRWTAHRRKSKAVCF